MPTITINGETVEFDKGQSILQAALAHDIEIPYYCYHPALSVVASCRICLVEVWAPNPRNDNKVEPIPKLMPACQTQAMEGQVVYSNSPKAVANQKAVMEYLLINHPLDCPVCDQAGECYLQDYSFSYGRGASRFEEEKIKQPKKDLGPSTLLYSDRCIMCSRCVRFTREVSGTAELCVEGRGASEQIDIFPGKALDNEIAGNVVDLCPVGALLDKDFLFERRVWELTSTPSIDPLTASGDNVWIDHADDKVYRVRPRENLQVNKWWISDEVRHGWRFVHSDKRLSQCVRNVQGAQAPCGHGAAVEVIVEGAARATQAGKRIGLMVSTMLSCEDAFLLALAARALDPQAILAVGPVPTLGVDHVYPPGIEEDDPKAFAIRAEKCPNARGVRHVLEAVAGDGGGNSEVLDFAAFERCLATGDIGACILTGGYPSEWATPALRDAAANRDVFTALIDALETPIAADADVLIPGATWAEKSGTFENVKGRLQAFEQAIALRPGAHSELETAAAILQRTSDANSSDDVNSAVDAIRAVSLGGALPSARGAGAVRESIRSGAVSGAASPAGYSKADAASTRPGPAAAPFVLQSLALADLLRRKMSAFSPALKPFVDNVHTPTPTAHTEPDMVVVEL